MPTDTEYLKCLGVGLQGLRASGQFCDAMVCVGSTRLLVHKLVLSAASKQLHDLALEFDMMPHRDRDQLEIIIPPDVSLYAVNMFINYLYTGEVVLNERVLAHIERLATLFGVSRLQAQCQEFIQHRATPDSQNLNLQREDSHIEPDSSCTNGAQPSEDRLIHQPGETAGRVTPNLKGPVAKQTARRSRGMTNVKGEPMDNGLYDTGRGQGSTDPETNKKTPQTKSSSMSVLEKLMSPVVNITKLPSNITPNVVVLVSDDENDDNDGNASVCSEPKTFKFKSGHTYTLAEKEAIAVEAKRFGTTQVANAKNIPLQDILSWMTVFGLRHQVNSYKNNHRINQEGDLAIVRWVIQQQDMNGYVDLNSMKQFALTVYHQTQPKFLASKTWLGNFLRRSMSVLQGTRFVRGNENNVVDVYGKTDQSPVATGGRNVAETPPSSEASSELHVPKTSGQHTALESMSSDEQGQDDGTADFDDNFHDDGDFGDDDDNAEDNFTEMLYSTPSSDLNTFGLTGNLDLSNIPSSSTPRQPGSIITPFGKRPIIIGQAKSFDAKAERKIVQWVLERNARDGYVFTDDFKDFARTLYKGSKPFGATQAWMKKFLRRNRAIKDVKFCSKFKNTYSNDEKMAAVAMARRYGTAYAAKHTGISHKMVHSWRLLMDRGQLQPATSVMNRVNATMPFSASPTPSTSTSPGLPRSASSSSLSSLTSSKSPQNTQALYGIVPEFETKIIQQMKEYQQREGSINYDEISRLAQAAYKETRPTFKASYSWIRNFLDRHKEETKDIELEHVTKVLMEDDSGNEMCLSKNLVGQPLSSDKISAMVDTALKTIHCADAYTTDASGQILINPDQQPREKTMPERRPIIVGPSVTFNRKTEKRLVEWALARQVTDGYVFTDDFKEFAKSVHQGPKHFSASSGWMSLFLRRHRELKQVLWKSKFKNNYSEAEKRAAIAEAKRLGTGHVGRKLGIDPALICAWRIKLDKETPKHSFWKGTKIRKYSWAKFNQPKFAPTKVKYGSESDAVRGIVPEFEQKIVEMILEEHKKEGSISYEEMSEMSQSVYKETRPTFKASYAWLRNFLKRHQDKLGNLVIENVKKFFVPEEDGATGGNVNDFNIRNFFPRRPIIVGRSRLLDRKSEKELVQWMLERQERDGYVFLDQFKAFAQSLYTGDKKFAATQAWRIKFMRRNHAAIKDVKFTSSFRNQYSLAEKRAIVLEAKKLGVSLIAQKTGIDNCLINAWKNKMEKSGEIPTDTAEEDRWAAKIDNSLSSQTDEFLSTLKKLKKTAAPGLCSVRGVVPKFEEAILYTIQNKMDNEGSVSYQDISNIARAAYKETRPNFKAGYKWIKQFIKRHKKKLRHVDIEHSSKIAMDDEHGIEVLIPEDTIEDVNTYMDTGEETAGASYSNWGNQGKSNPSVFIENAEDPNYESRVAQPGASTSKSGINIDDIASRKPVIVGLPVHFNRKAEKKLVEWLFNRQSTEGFVFTDDFRDYARSQYTGPPHKFGATNAWINKFMRRNRLANKIIFQSRLKGNNPKYEEKIVELVLKQQEKEGSVSNDDIQRLSQLVYKEIRPNFRACYNWIKDFIKRHSEELKGVELENVKKYFIPDSDYEKDGVLIRDVDPMKGLTLSEGHGDYQGQVDTNLTGTFDGSYSHDSSWMDVDDSIDDSGFGHSQPNQQFNSSSSKVLDQLVQRKRPVIIAPPKMLDIKTEKKVVHWMLEQQSQNGCVYLDLFKEYAKSLHTGPKHFAATQAWMMRFKQRNHAALKGVVIRSRFRKDYTIAEKMAAVEEARRLGCHHVGRKLGINGGVIYSWKVQLEQAEKFGGMPFTEPEPRTPSSSSYGINPQIEKAIVDMIMDVQRNKGSVSGEEISQCAIAVYQETRPNFKGSKNWRTEFLRRNKDALEDVNFENKRKLATDEEKLHILSEEKKYGAEHVMKKRNISYNTIRHWKHTMKARSIPIPKYKALLGSKIKNKYVKGKKTPRTYTMEEKRKMVAVAEQNGVTRAGLKLGVSRNMISKWVSYFRKQGENIVINYTHASVVKKELEQRVAEWVLKENDELGVVMTNRIQEYAKKVFEEAYTSYNATDYWLEGFITQNGEKFEHVRFRQKGDVDLEFTDEVKFKLARYAEKHGAGLAAEKCGISTNTIYHWRRVFRQKGIDYTSDHYEIPGKVMTSATTEPKSLMQQKLDKIAARFNLMERKRIVDEAAANGTSSTASKYKIPLPLILKWMKGPDSSPGRGPALEMSRSFDSMSSKESTPDSRSFSDSKMRSPSSERTKLVSGFSKYSEDFKRELVKEAKVLGVTEAAGKHGIPYSTLYHWVKDPEKEANSNSNRTSLERPRLSFEGSRSSFGSRSSMESEKDIAAAFNIENIKKEPDLESSNTAKPHSGSSAGQLYASAFTSYKPRKYTEQEKADIVQRALEIGIKQASEELNIPRSNVRRWTDTHKTQLKKTEVSQKKKEKYHELREAKLLEQERIEVCGGDVGQGSAMNLLNKNTADDFVDGGIGLGAYHSGENFAASSHDGAESLERKRKLAVEVDMERWKRRRFSTNLTEEEKLEFVRESQTKGAKVAAMNAGVSIDVVYKWRQKFLHRAFTSYQSPTATTNTVANSASSQSTNEMLKAIKTEAIDSDEFLSVDGSDAQSENIPERAESVHSVQDSLVQPSDVMLDDQDVVDLSRIPMGDHINKSPVSALEDLVGGTGSLGGASKVTNEILPEDIPPMDHFMQNSAASHILKMTESYIENEKAHENETNQLKNDVSLNEFERGPSNELNAGIDSLNAELDCEIVLNDDFENESLNGDDVDVVGDRAHPSNTESAAGGNHMENIQIVNVKSEALVD